MKFLFLVCSFLGVCGGFIQAQDLRINGRVIDSTGQPIPGASVIIQGTGTGAQTSNDGAFTLVVQGNSTLEVTAIGYAKVTRRVDPNVREYVFRMTAALNPLDEVVVTAGGIQARKREEGYAATRISSESITQAKAVNVASSLSGKVAGLQVNAINGGVNPTVRLVLRGNRSLLGNNEALVVLDNVIVPANILGNLNPEDIEDINVLNGAGAAALYGSEASNGAIIITTKRGSKGQDVIKVSNTTTIESVSYQPKLQKDFGAGYATNEYVGYENQQYGPRFDGTLREIGRPDIYGNTLSVPYSATTAQEDFWQNGITNQTDLSIASNTNSGSTYFSLQYASIQGTTPKDEYNRISVRYNGTKKIGNNFNLGFAVNYVQNRYDLTTQTATIYNNLLNTPANIPLLDYKNWQTDYWSSPEGYYNDYYMNPYFYVDNYRSKTRNDYLTGSVDFNWKPIRGFDVVYRVGFSTRNNDAQSRVGIYNMSDPFYLRGGKANFNVPGSVSESMAYTTQLTSDLMITYRKQINDFSIEVMGGQHLRNNVGKSIGGSTSGGMVIPDLYNIGNTVQNVNTSSASFNNSRQIGVYGKAKFGYKNWLFLDVTARNDWRSVLNPDNWSFFYPAFNLSFVASDAIPALQNSNVIDMLKIRGGWSQVGNVNLGAYNLKTTWSSTGGFPFPTAGPGYSINGGIVDPTVLPELTTQYEVGFDMDLLDRRLNVGFTYFDMITDRQTVSPQISRSTGFSSYLQNTGEVSNKGIELMLHYTVIRNKDLNVTIGGNYSYLDNFVLSMSDKMENLQLSTGGAAQVYAIAGQRFPVLLGVDYLRDPQGRIIVDPITGYPSADPVQKNLGNTNPIHKLGLDLEVRWKNFRLWALAEYRGGFVIYHNGGSTLDFSGSSSRTTMYNRERFVFPNSSIEVEPGKFEDNTNVQVRDGGADFWANGPNRSIATNYITKGDFWKLREVSLSYEVPKSFVNRIKGVKGASISVQGRNLLLFTAKSNIYTDPEYNFSDGNAIGITTLGQTPPSRYYGGTISITF